MIWHESHLYTNNLNNYSEIFKAESAETNTLVNLSI